MRNYCGECWTGPVTGAICDTCHKPGCVNQLAMFRNGEVMERFQKFQCLDCSNAEILRARADRKAQLDAMERCEVPGCKIRGTWKAGSAEKVLLCGRHLKQAQREHQKKMAAAGGLGLFLGMETTGPQILKSLAD